MRHLIFALLLALPLPARSDGTAGEFDYYILSLSWSPNWCALEGDAQNSPQCDASADFGWVMHGLWPQYETGWPSNCRTSFSAPSRQQTAAMADIMGTSGLAWHEWNTHGVCSGLSPADYFALARRAYETVAIPAAFKALTKQVTIRASVIEEAFTDKNPTLDPDEVRVTCTDGHIQEVRICLTRDLDFRTCGADASFDCTLTNAIFDPVR